MKLVKSSPPVFEVEIARDGVPTVVRLKALYWYQYDEAARQDILKTSIDRFSTYKNFDQWLACCEYQQLDEWRADQRLIVGNADGLIYRKDLLSIYNITGSALNNRIETMGHPKPIKLGRKHWFNADECDNWVASQKTK